jgi:hypothetical protein
LDNTKRRIEITIDRRRLLILKRRVSSVSERCEHCGDQAAMLTPDEAAMLAMVSSRVIYRMVESGEIHYRETADGGLLICANSVGMA